MPNNRSERKASEPSTVVEVSAQQARDNLAEMLNRAEYGGERIRIVRHGKAVAALIGLADFARLNEAA
ncbi:type II toxin-antitoxin system Phd/YefM family antitoxin [Humibacter sp.]|uniref:type II toxin-antitoxin system Phd/YefM family antitoxin n=1 Tax=Humibacter sp. TaxID=1940291 RepID=UPI003F822742